MSWNAQTLVFLLVLGATSAHAQDGGVPGWTQDDPFSEGEDDPLGVDREDRLERVEPTRPDEEVQRSIPVVQGVVLGAIAGVQEEHHEVEVELDHGLARVRTSMRFMSRARHAAEVRYRLAVPEGASLAALEVCNRHGCRTGAIDTNLAPVGAYDDAVRARGAGRLPIAHAAPVTDDAGSALWIRAAPLLPRVQRVRGAQDETWLDVRVTYVVEAPVRGARVRLTLPARGDDNRIAPSRIRVRSERLSGGTADGVDAVERPVERAAWQPVEVAARRTRAGGATQAEAWTVHCGEGRCARVRVVAAPAAARARDIVLLLDASPSTADSARGRIGPAVAALLSTLPSRSRLRVAAFAARAEAIVEAPTSPTEISLVRVSRALESPLGIATRFEAAWALIEPWVREMNDPLVLVVGDGGLTSTDRTARAFTAARRAGAEVAVLDVADRPTTSAMREALERIDARWIDAGAEARRAAAGHGMEPLAERIAPLLAPVAEPRVRARVGRRVVELGALHHGEEIVWEGVLDRGSVALLRPSRTRSASPPEAFAVSIRDRLERVVGRRDVATRLTALAPESVSAAPGTCSTRERPRSASAVVRAQARLIPAHTRRCDRAPFPVVSAPTDSTTQAAPPSLHPDTGESRLPERSLLGMLRQRIVPAARSCFRNDRRGRPAYQRRAVFEFRLADREVVEARVTGSIAAPLRECLESAMDTLDIPPFDGTVNVRYPVYTAARLPPPVLTLDSDVADAVDSVAGEE